MGSVQKDKPELFFLRTVDSAKETKFVSQLKFYEL